MIFRKGERGAGGGRRAAPANRAAPAASLRRSSAAPPSRNTPRLHQLSAGRLFSSQVPTHTTIADYRQQCNIKNTKFTIKEQVEETKNPNPRRSIPQFDMISICIQCAVFVYNAVAAG